MADTYLTSPRRVEVTIKLHAGEVANVACQAKLMSEFTEEELQKIIETAHAELNYRREKNDK